MEMLIVASVGRVLLSIALIAVSILLIGIILLQKNRGSGLSGAFGGVGGHSAFGTKTGDMLTWVTVGMTAVLMLLAIVGTFVFEEKPLDASLQQAPAQLPAQTELPPVDAAEGGEATTPATTPPATTETPAAPTGEQAPTPTPTPTPAPTTGGEAGE